MRALKLTLPLLRVHVSRYLMMQEHFFELAIHQTNFLGKALLSTLPCVLTLAFSTEMGNTRIGTHVERHSDVVAPASNGPLMYSKKNELHLCDMVASRAFCGHFRSNCIV
jgi:hypothetical protein